MYSFPLTMSSSAVTRSLRRRGTEARETLILSSSLSCQAALRLVVVPSIVSSSSLTSPFVCADGGRPVPVVSVKKSCRNVQLCALERTTARCAFCIHRAVAHAIVTV